MKIEIQTDERRYEPFRHPACTDETIDDCDDCWCCYCAGCDYSGRDEIGWPYCVVCGQHEVFDDEPVRY